ncbi:MAG: HAMP domain-containing histidine kinase [Bacteroidales bacterium]|nr:HAMP domain-containing histidine kinase [Bacteroidales bacterium]
MRIFIVKADPEEIRDLNGAVHRYINQSTIKQGENKFLYVGTNLKLAGEIRKTLNFFTFVEEGINVIQTNSLDEAKELITGFSGFTFVLVDSSNSLNGSYDAFLSYVSELAIKSQVYVTTTEKLMKAIPSREEIDKKNEKAKSEIESTRLRLTEIVRMILLTNEIDQKLNNKQGIGLPFKIPDLSLQGKNKSTNITRDKLYNILAHELKEPIGNIKVMIDFLTNEKDLLDQKTYNDLLVNVRESVDSINELLDDFLFWTRMNKHHIQYNPRKISIDHVMRENLTLLKSMAAEKNIVIETNIDEELAAYADEYMVTTVMRNLIYNAIKFTREKGKIVITAVEKVNYIEVKIRDNGVGIPESIIGKIFRSDVYYKTRGTSKETGAGIGLVLCKDFIEKNGGKIMVESIVSQGTTFHFTLPVWENVSAN